MIRGLLFLGFLALLPLWIPLGLEQLGIRISLLPLVSSWMKTEPAETDGTAPPAGWREHVYLARNPDVAAAVRQGALRSGYEHYVKFGQAEGRTGGFAPSAAPTEPASPPAQPAPAPPPPVPATAAAAAEAPPPPAPAASPPVVAAVPQAAPQAIPQPPPAAVAPVAVPPAKPPVPPPAPSAAAPSTVLVSGIRAGTHDGFTRIVLDVNAPPRLERAAQSAPRAVGIEMANAVWRMARQGRLTAKALSYRIDEAPRGASRLIIESQEPIQLKSMFVLPPEGDRGYRVVLDVARAARSGD